MTERLDRIERILEGLATSQQADEAWRSEFRADMDLLRQQQQATHQTTDSNTRAIAASREEAQQWFQEMRALTTSTARTAEANANAIAELRQSFEASIPDLVGMIQGLAQSLEAYRIEASADRAELRNLVERMYGDRTNGNN